MVKRSKEIKDEYESKLVVFSMTFIGLSLGGCNGKKKCDFFIIEVIIKYMIAHKMIIFLFTLY